MIRAYDDNGNVVDLVEWEKQIKADAIDEFMTYSKKWCKEDKVHIQDLTIIADKIKGAKK